jgi:hypothetical protein
MTWQTLRSNLSLAYNRAKRKALTIAACFTTKRLIIVLTPGYEHPTGGVLSIAAIYRETKAMRRIHRAKVVLCAVPGDDPLFFKYSWFKNRNYLLDLNSVLLNCADLDYLLLHIPEYAVNQVLVWLNWASTAYLRNVRQVHLNILLQNIECVRGQNVSELKRFGTVTCTTAHEAYTNSATRDALGVSVHRLGVCCGPELYPRSGYLDKQPLLVVSNDPHPMKEQVLRRIAEGCPHLKIRVIQNLSYEAYRKLIRHAKWSLTFGEGLDGYFAEEVWSGGVAFAVFNDRYFTPAFSRLETVYPSWEVLLERMPADLYRLDEPVAYARCWREPYDLLNDLYNTERFRGNLQRFYRAEYTFPIRMDALPRDRISHISMTVKTAPRKVIISEMFWLDVEITNGTNEPLYSCPPFPVRLSYHWIQEATHLMAVFDGERSELFPRAPANTTTRCRMLVIAPSEPGKYILQTTIVQDGVCWFENICPGIMHEFVVEVDAETHRATFDSSRVIEKLPEAASIEQPLRAGVTIGLPIYRGQLFLEESLVSVRSQTYSDIEVILSLDGPDPECEEICRKFLIDYRFRLVVQPHRLGWMNHTNWLMDQVQTEFWHLQEQDDVIEPTFLATLVKHARAHPGSAVVFSDLRTFGTTDTHMEMSPVIGSSVIRQMKLIHEHFNGVAPLGLIRTEALRMSGGLQANEFENFAADTALMAGLARWGELHRLPQELYRKRVHPQSTCAAWWDWARERRFKAWQAHCLEMLRQALLVDATLHNRRLLWLAVIERLVSPRTAHFLSIAELTAAERADMLDSFLTRVRSSSIDVTGPLGASWDEIESWTRGYYSPDVNREISGKEKLSPETIAKISLEVSAVPQEVRVSQVFWLDAKVSNRTNKTFYPSARFPVRLAYHWLQNATREMVVFDGKRSELLPVMEANAAGVYPMMIIAPSQPGEYILQTTMVQDGVCWLEDIRADIVQEFAVSVTA